MTDAELPERLWVNILGLRRLQSQTAALRCQEWPGVRAFAIPGRADVLHQQLVLYERTEALAQALASLEEWYRRQRVPAWSVPVRPGQPATEALLAAAGYQPVEGIPIMGLRLEGALAPAPPPGLTLERPDNLDAVIELNARCYGPETVRFIEAWRAPPLPSPRLYAVLVREAGRALAGGFSFEEGGLAGIYCVATHPDARRRGLGSLVMRALHADALARGLAVVLLQSTVLGRGLYQRLGYRDLGAWSQWVKHAPGEAPT